LWRIFPKNNKSTQIYTIKKIPIFQPKIRKKKIVGKKIHDKDEEQKLHL
jgi:hypothetical protein